MNEKDLLKISIIIFITGLLLTGLLSTTTPPNLEYGENPDPLKNPTRTVTGKIIKVDQTEKTTFIEIEIKQKIKLLLFEKINLSQSNLATGTIITAEGSFKDFDTFRNQNTPVIFTNKISQVK